MEEFYCVIANRFVIKVKKKTKKLCTYGEFDFDSFPPSSS